MITKNEEMDREILSHANAGSMFIGSVWSVVRNECQKKWNACVLLLSLLCGMKMSGDI